MKKAESIQKKAMNATCQTQIVTHFHMCLCHILCWGFDPRWLIEVLPCLFLSGSQVCLEL
jgi:hypothetical protein